MKIPSNHERVPLLSSVSIKSDVPKGMGAVPDRLEPALSVQEGFPSLFKKFLFEPFIYLIKSSLRFMFKFFDWLRSAVSDQQASGEAPGIDGKMQATRIFLDHLKTAPRPEDLLLQFKKIFSAEEKNKIYFFMGKKQVNESSWGEWMWPKSAQQNIALGKRVIRENPELIRPLLIERLEQITSP